MTQEVSRWPVTPVLGFDSRPVHVVYVVYMVYNLPLEQAFSEYLVFSPLISLGGLGVACWPLVPKFAGSSPAKAVGFLRAKKSSARLPSEGK